MNASAAKSTHKVGDIYISEDIKRDGGRVFGDEPCGAGVHPNSMFVLMSCLPRCF